uniref:AMP-activated protein kinase glycogen-binding domain-containing protein n=1 Tax=Romanomermis culicivorax TaxID=13658 RepID=A0A915I958_ROMCU
MQTDEILVQHGDQGSYHECPLCNMPLRIVEIIFDEGASYPEDPTVDDPNSLYFSTDKATPFHVDQGETTICLIGSFTGWSTKIAIPTTKTVDNTDSNLNAEPMAIKLMLPKGHHEFKFLKNDKKFLNSNYGKCRALNREDQFNFIDSESNMRASTL